MFYNRTLGAYGPLVPESGGPVLFIYFIVNSEVSGLLLLLLLMLLLQNSCQIFATPSKSLQVSQNILHVFLLGTVSCGGGGGCAFAWISQLGSPVRSPCQSMELPTRFSIRSSTINLNKKLGHLILEQGGHRPPKF